MALLNRHTRIALGVAGTTALLATKDGATAADLSDRTPFAATGMHLGAVQLQSAGVMYFSRDGTLFLADPRGAAIYAIDVGDTYRDTSRTGVEITDVDGKIAAALGTTRDQIRIADMVAHPTSQSLYFSLTRGKGNDAVPALVRVTKADEKVTVLPLENIRNARADIPDAPRLMRRHRGATRSERSPSPRPRAGRWRAVRRRPRERGVRIHPATHAVSVRREGSVDDGRDVSHVPRSIRDGVAYRVVRRDRPGWQAVARGGLRLLTDCHAGPRRARGGQARARQDGRGARRRQSSVRHDPLHEREGERVHPRREQQPDARRASIRSSSRPQSR